MSRCYQITLPDGTKAIIRMGGKQRPTEADLKAIMAARTRSTPSAPPVSAPAPLYEELRETGGHVGASLVSFEDPDDTTEEHERRIKRCSSCNARIIWLLTKNLKHIPVDADTVEPHDTDFDNGRHVSHFATCPNANQHRRAR